MILTCLEWLGLEWFCLVVLSFNIAFLKMLQSMFRLLFAASQLVQAHSAKFDWAIVLVFAGFDC